MLLIVRRCDMSDRDLILTGTGPTWLYALSALLFCAALAGWCLLWIQTGPWLIACWRRGCAYRQRIRSAKHARRLVTR